MNPETEHDREEQHAQSDPTVPDTRAPKPGTPPDAGRVSPAEKAEPSGVPIEEQEIPNHPPPSDAGQGTSSQENDPLESQR